MCSHHDCHVCRLRIRQLGSVIACKSGNPMMIIWYDMWRFLFLSFSWGINFFLRSSSSLNKKKSSKKNIPRHPEAVYSSAEFCSAIMKHGFAFFHHYTICRARVCLNFTHIRSHSACYVLASKAVAPCIFSAHQPVLCLCLERELNKTAQSITINNTASRMMCGMGTTNN